MSVTPMQQAIEEYRRLRDIVLDVHHSGKTPSRTQVAAMWQQVLEVLKEYRLQDNMRDPVNRPIDHLPVEITLVIERNLGELVAGKLPDLFEVLLRAGAPGILPHERQDIENAVLYREAVREGLIDDRSPNKTIREAYGVAESTVRSWVKRYPMSVNDFLPGARQQAKARAITNGMRQSATRFSATGRSHKAVTARYQTP